MKIKSQSWLSAMPRIFSPVFFPGFLLLLSINGRAQNLFMADAYSNSIFEFTPGGARTTFASGLSYPVGMAFDSAGNMYEADDGSGNIYKFTPGGVRSTFASGLVQPYSLAFDRSGNLFVGTYGGVAKIIKITPTGVKSTFASGLSDAVGLAFNSAGTLFESDMGSEQILEFTPGGSGISLCQRQF